MLLDLSGCLFLRRECWAGDIEAANLGRGRINVSGSTISSAARRFQGAPEVGLPTGFRRSAIQQFRDLQTGELHSGHSNTDSEPNLSALQHLQIGAQEPTPSNLGPYEASFPRPVTVPSETHSRDNFPQFRSNDGQSTQNLKDNCFSRSAQPSSFRIRSSSLPPRYPLVDQPSEGLQGSRQQSGVSRLQHETNLARLNLAAERDTSNALSSDRQTSPSHHNRHLMRVQKHLDNLNVYGEWPNLSAHLSSRSVTHFVKVLEVKASNAVGRIFKTSASLHCEVYESQGTSRMSWGVSGPCL